MVLDNKTIEKIKSLVYHKPRSVNDIAVAIDKNWRTADRYVEQIMLRTGTIKTITFREGTRGALKIVYWNNTDKVYATDVQEKIFKNIERGIDKSDFSPFEIYEYVDPAKRYGYYELVNNENKYDYNIKTLIPFFESVEKEICIFAGNLAFVHLTHKGKKILDYLKDCVGRGVSIKIISNVNIVDLKNIELVNSLNVGLATPLIEIRHDLVPIRAYIFDTTIIKMGEMLNGYRKTGQEKKQVAVYYEVRDEQWIEWLQKIFWKKFQNSVRSALMIENLNTLKQI